MEVRKYSSIRFQASTMSQDWRYGSTPLIGPNWGFWGGLFKVLHYLLPEIRVASPSEAQQQQEQRYPLLSVCHAVFSCIQTTVWLPILGIFKVHTDDDACDCTRGLYGHRKRVCTGSWLMWEKKPLPCQGLRPASVLSECPNTGLRHPSFNHCRI